MPDHQLVVCNAVEKIDHGVLEFATQIGKRSVDGHESCVSFFVAWVVLGVL